MSNFSTYNETGKSALKFFMFVFLFAFSFSAFSQSEVDNSIVDKNEVKNNIVKFESSRMSSNMELIMWFMGSKQDPNSTISKDGINAKKEIISSGTAPNRLLIKAFLKKAVSYENSLT